MPPDRGCHAQKTSSARRTSLGGALETFAGRQKKLWAEKILLWATSPALLAVQHALRAEKSRCLSPTEPHQPKTSRCRASTGACEAPQHLVGGSAEPPSSQKLFLAKNNTDARPGRSVRPQKCSCSRPAGDCGRFARLAGWERESFFGQRPCFFGQQPLRRTKPSS